MIIAEVRGGRDDRRAPRLEFCAGRPAQRSRSRDVRRRKVRTPQGAMVGNTHRPSRGLAARIGKVPQKTDRLGHGSWHHGRGKGETAR